MTEKLYKLREDAKAEGMPVIRDQSFKLLLDTVKRKKPSSILEIGVNTGLSGVAMLLECENARLTGIEIDAACVERAKENYKLFGVEERAKIFIGDASEIIPVLTGKYDFIFLDGPKGHYYEYLPHLLCALNEGGTLFADNVLFRGYVTGEVRTPHRYATVKHSMENFLKAVTSDKNLTTTVYTFEDGVSVTEKTVRKTFRTT